MAINTLCRGLAAGVFFCALQWHSGPAWAAHDQGQGKSQHPDSGTTTIDSVSVAPEPSSMLLFAAGGALVAFRCRKHRRDR